MSIRIKQGNRQIVQTPTQSTAGFLVRFFDIDGTILKEERVLSGRDATPPALPYHEYLTFYEWNNDYTNITEDMDCGALYDTVDYASYVFITLNPVTGTYIEFNYTLVASDTITIEWGDDTFETNSTTGDVKLTHTYDTIGDYVIRISGGISGSYYLGWEYPKQYYIIPNAQNAVTKAYLGSYHRYQMGYQLFRNHKSIDYVSLQPNLTTCFSPFDSSSITHVNLPRGTDVPQNCINTTYRCKYLIPNINRGGYQTGMVLNGYGVVEYPKHSGYSLYMPGCKSLTRIVTRPTITTVTSVGSCSSLIYVELQENVTTIGNSAFSTCSALLTVIIKTITPPTAGTTIFNGINKLCKIYVPDDSVNDYKTATNWIDYADYIYPLSEYIG